MRSYNVIVNISNFIIGLYLSCEVLKVLDHYECSSLMFSAVSVIGLFSKLTHIKGPNKTLLLIARLSEPLVRNVLIDFKIYFLHMIKLEHTVNVYDKMCFAV